MNVIVGKIINLKVAIYYQISWASSYNKWVVIININIDNYKIVFLL